MYIKELLYYIVLRKIPDFYKHNAIYMNKDCSAKRKINYESNKWERWIILESPVN